MGCQTEIAQEIVDASADYVLAVKGNQPTLHEGIAEFFLKHLEDDFAGVKVSRHEKCERVMAAKSTVLTMSVAVPEDLPDRSRWAQLNAIGIAISETMRDGKPCSDVRHYILSKKLSARRFADGGAQSLGD